MRDSAGDRPVGSWAWTTNENKMETSTNHALKREHPLHPFTLLLVP